MAAGDNNKKKDKKPSNNKPQNKPPKAPNAAKPTERAVEAANDAGNAADGMTADNAKWWMPLVIVLGVVAGVTVVLMIINSYFGQGMMQ